MNNNKNKIHKDHLENSNFKLEKDSAQSIKNKKCLGLPKL